MSKFQNNNRSTGVQNMEKMVREDENPQHNIKLQKEETPSLYVSVLL